MRFSFFRSHIKHEGQTTEAGVENPEILHAKLWVPEAVQHAGGRDVLRRLPRGQSQHSGADA